MTQPDKPVGRKQELTAPPVKVLAHQKKIRVLQKDKVTREDIEEIVPHPDFLVVVAFGQIVKQDLLDLPKIAPVNVHASLLPRWRGASPIQHAILSGDTETGVTLQRMVKELDAGPIIAQSTYEIDERETSESLFEKLSVMGAELLVSTLKKPITEAEQDESKATHCKKLSRADSVVDPTTMSAEEIDRKVRALVPWPGVQCDVQGQSVKIIEASLTPSPDAIELLCKSGTLFITKLQSPGKKAMDAKEWLRGITR